MRASPRIAWQLYQKLLGCLDKESTCGRAHDSTEKKDPRSCQKEANTLFCCSNILSTLICATSMSLYNWTSHVIYAFLITHIIHIQLIILPNTNHSLSISLLYISFTNCISSYNLFRRINTNRLLYILSTILMYNFRSLLFFCCLLWTFLSPSFLLSCQSSYLALITTIVRDACVPYFKIIQKEKYLSS